MRGRDTCITVSMAALGCVTTLLPHVVEPVWTQSAQQQGMVPSIATMRAVLCHVCLRLEVLHTCLLC
jgi:hypothetical protein